MFEAVEKFSVVKTLQAIGDANVVILLLDARPEIADQDAHIAGYILEAGRALVVAVNKWDGLDEDTARDASSATIDRKLHFLRWARVHTISALQGHRPRGGDAVGDRSASRPRLRKLPTPRLTRALQAAVARQQPPRAGQRAPKCAMRIRAARTRRSS